MSLANDGSRYRTASVGGMAVTKAKTGVQAGIITRPQGHLLLLALNFSGDRTPDGTRNSLGVLQDVVRRELDSDLDDQNADTPKDGPSPETGELGFEDGYTRYFLTVTLGISKSGFEALGVPQELQPADLIPIPWSDLGDQPPTRPDGTTLPDGELILQICSDNEYINEHVARRIEEELSSSFTVTWSQAGVQRHMSRSGRTTRREGRALIGFHDGQTNLNPRHDDDDADLVFVDPDAVPSYPGLPTDQPDPYSAGASFPVGLRQPPAREPEWTKDGTYMVVRSSEIDITSWDRLPLGQQEAIVGRFKYSGSSLDLLDHPRSINDEPAFASDPASRAVALSSHARKTGPRRPGSDDAGRRIFRRGYPLIEATAEGVRRGLVFICFGRTISTQFEFTVRAWMNNPNFPEPNAGVDMLRTFDKKVLNGGYYFVPRLQRRSEAWTWDLPF